MPFITLVELGERVSAWNPHRGASTHVTVNTDHIVEFKNNEVTTIKRKIEVKETRGRIEELIAECGHKNVEFRFSET